MLRCLSMSFIGEPDHAIPMWNLRSGTFHWFDIGGHGISIFGAFLISSSVSPSANGSDTKVLHASASPGKLEGLGRKLMLRRSRKACSNTRRNSDWTHMGTNRHRLDTAATKRA